MRDIFVLSRAIKKEIPDEAGYNAARAAIDVLMKKWAYRAPETWAPGWFNEMAVILNGYLPAPSPDCEWATKIGDIFSGKIQPGRPR